MVDDNHLLQAPADARAGGPAAEKQNSSPAQSASPRAARFSIDTWSNRLAAWAQVGTLAVLIFGYFYTVQPAFQLAELQEKTSHLQILNDAAEKQLAATIAAQVQASTQLAAMQADYARVARNRDEFAAQLKQESQREADAQRKMSGVQSQLSTQAGNLLLAQRRLFYSRFSSASTFRGFAISPSPKDDDANGDFITQAEAAWPNPELTVLGILDQLEKTDAQFHEYPPEFLVPLLRIAEQRKADLKCEPVDLESIRAAYKDAYSHLDELANKHAEDEIQKQVEEARAKHQRLTGIDEARPAFRRNARYLLWYSLQQDYGGQINALMKACQDKESPVLESMRQKILSGS